MCRVWAFFYLISAYVRAAPQSKRNNAAKGRVFCGRPQRYRVKSMMEFLGALVVIGIFVIWCDFTGAWNNVLPSDPRTSSGSSQSNPIPRDDFRSGPSTGRTSFQERGARAGRSRAAMTEYEAHAIATREKTARLKALRLAKEAVKSL